MKQILLISDREENWGLNPWQRATSLESQGTDFTAYVIDLDLDLKTSQQLECIADATGGKYFSVKHASSDSKS